MRTNNFWQIVAIVAMFVGMVNFTSCGEDDVVLPEDSKDIVDSEIVEGGLEETVKEEPIEGGGVSISYKTWIQVKGSTRGSFDKRVEAVLNNKLADISCEVSVNHWEIGQDLKYSFLEVGESKTEDNVTIIDSVFVYRVQYLNFAIDIKLPYQVARYDDGYTNQLMPYYLYSNITDLGGEFKTYESIERDGKAYAKRTYTHKIAVDFNGKTYKVTANVLLLRELGPSSEPYILASRLESAELVPRADGDYDAKMHVIQKWTNQPHVDKYYCYQVRGALCKDKIGPIEVSNFKGDLKFEFAGTRGAFLKSEEEKEPYFFIQERDVEYVVGYNYDITFVTHFLMSMMYYNDGVSFFEVPQMQFDIHDDFTLEKGKTDVDEKGKFQWYRLTHMMEGDVSGQKKSGVVYVDLKARL